ncbi:hypothetical protein GGR54DRAFT_638114 [Hypoxylon sp. NC1633]|nr:hypothetical protein GGR54DRAFT_638114 [Hypoxylon sp. NC1633]
MALKYFRTGTKQVFLPDRTVTLLRPRESQPPNFANFQVPLTFNKLDLRDYLLHAYNVPVLGVRSQLTQRRPERSKLHHRITRPPPIKTMVAELHQPFVFPPEPEDKSQWITPQQEKQQAALDHREKSAKRLRKSGSVQLRDEGGADTGRVALKKEAQRLLKGAKWEDDRELDPKFTEKKRGR